MISQGSRAAGASTGSAGGTYVRPAGRSGTCASSVKHGTEHPNAMRLRRQAGDRRSETVLFIARQAFSGLRSAIASRDCTTLTVFAALEHGFRILDEAPTYVLTDKAKTVTICPMEGVLYATSRRWNSPGATRRSCAPLLAGGSGIKAEAGFLGKVSAFFVAE